MPRKSRTKRSNNNPNIYIPSQNQDQQQTSSRRRTRRRRYRSRWLRGNAPTSYGYSFSPYVRQVTTRSGAVHLYARETFPITIAESDVLSFALPFTPSKWKETRTGTLVSTYQTFRPIKIRLTWQPSISTATAGTIAFGTVFAGNKLSYEDAVSASNALISTNGGFQSTVWRMTSRMVQLGTSLPRNNYPTTAVNPDDIPLWIVSAVQGLEAEGIIGHLVVDMQLSLTNPVNSGINTLPSTIYTSTIIQESEPVPRAYFNLPTSVLNGVSVGDQLWIAPLKNLVNSDGGILTNILEMITVTLKSITEGVYEFLLPPQFANQAFQFVFGGRPSNFY